MLKYVETMVVFTEIPDEITLAINISNCPCHCPGCHSKYLWEDKGKDLTQRVLDRLIISNDGITCVCFMGGDSEPDLVNLLAERVHSFGLKSAWYSGKESISDKIDLKNFDYVKIGPYIEEKGPLTCKTTNQVLFEIKDLKLEDITYKLQKSDTETCLQ